MFTYTEVLTMIKRADYQSYLNSAIPKKLPTQTSQQYKQRVTALDPSRVRQQDTSTFNAMLGPNHDMLNTNNIMTSPGGTQRQAQTAAAGQGIKDYYKNTTWQQQARNAGAAATGAAIGTAKGFLGAPFLLANAAGWAADLAGKPLGMPSLQANIKQVTGGVTGALDNINNTVAGKLGAQNGVANAASGVAQFGSGIAFPSAGQTLIATKPGAFLSKFISQKLGNAGKLAPAYNAFMHSKFKAPVAQAGMFGFNQGLTAAAN